MRRTRGSCIDQPRSSVGSWRSRIHPCSSPRPSPGVALCGLVLNGSLELVLHSLCASQEFQALLCARAGCAPCDFAYEANCESSRQPLRCYSSLLLRVSASAKSFITAARDFTQTNLPSVCLRHGERSNRPHTTTTPADRFRRRDAHYTRLHSSRH